MIQRLRAFLTGNWLALAAIFGTPKLPAIASPTTRPEPTPRESPSVEYASRSMSRSRS